MAPKAASTGDAQASEGSGRLVADKPMLIYVTAEDATSVATRKLEDISFKDERVAIGAKFFRCIKISAGDAAQDRLLKEAGSATPRLILVKRNYEVIKVLEKKLEDLKSERAKTEKREQKLRELILLRELESQKAKSIG